MDLGEKAEDVVKSIEEKYKADETDEFLKPLIVNGDAGRIKGQSSGLLALAYCLSDFFTLLRWRYSVLLQLSFRSYARDRIRTRTSG